MALYSWSFHHDDDILGRLQTLKRDLTELCLWHVFQMARTGIRNFEDGLYDWTMVWRYLPWRSRSIPSLPQGRDNPLWQEFSQGLNRIYTSFMHVEDVESFTRAAMEFVTPLYEQEEGYEDANATRMHEELASKDAQMNWFGCFRYTVGDPGVEDRAEMHINNNAAPDSPFADKRRMFSWLHDMAKDIVQKAPHVKRIGTGSWLNIHPAFLEAYPPSYRDSLVLLSADRKRGMGWWGQFITLRVTLNERRADILKKERRFDCFQYEGVCSFDEFRRRVEAQLSNQI